MDSRRNYNKNVDNADSSTNAVAFGWARENARYYLKSAIDEEVDNLDDVTPQTWKIATHNVVKRLKDSTQMSDLIDDVKKRLKIYSGSTCLHIENRAEPIPISNLKPLSSVSKRKPSKVDATRPKHQQQLAEDTSPNQPLKVRLEAFKNLLNSHLPTVVSSESWPLLQKNLIESLCDANAEIFSYCLQMHVKLLASTSNIMKDGFLGLIDGLRTHYARKFHKYLPTFDGGLDFTNPVHQRIIKISNLLLETSKGMTENWIRMGEKIIEEIMNVFLALITMHSYESMCSKNIMYPFHVFAALDPRAKWCLQWVHCGFGRNILLSLQSRIVTLLRFIVEEMNQSISSPFISSDSENAQDSITKGTKIIYSVNIKLSVFSHCVHILCIILPYTKGRMFFPLLSKIQSEPLSFPEVLCWLVEHLNRSYHSKYNLDFITDALVRFFKSRECPLSLCSEVINTVLEPMENILYKESVEFCYKIPLHTIYILEALCYTETGVVYLVECSNFKNRENGPYQIDTPPNLERPHNYILTILNYTDFLMNQNIANLRPLIQLLHVSSKFIKYLDFTLMFVPLTLIENIIIQFLLLHEQFKPKFSYTEINYVSSSSEDLFCSLSYFLANVFSWPGGLRSILHTSNIIQDFVPSLFAYSTVLWESPDFCQLLLMLSTLAEAESILSSECRKPVSEALQNLWKVLEDQESFIKGTDRDSQKALLRFMNIVYIFTTTLGGTKVFFSEFDDSDETLLECACNPSSPVELINMESAHDPWHKVSLLTLHALTRNLNAWIYIESKFDIENRLLQLQSENVPSSVFDDAPLLESDLEKDIIIDEYSILRHEILLAVRTVNTYSENIIPGLNCEGLYSYLSVPCSPVEHEIKVNEHSCDVTCELSQLLVDSELMTYDKNWMVKLRKAFRTLNEGDLKTNMIVTLLNHVYLCSASENNVLDWQSVLAFESENLSPEEILGIKITVRYGIEDNLLDCDVPNNTLLGQLLRHVQAVLNIDQNNHSFRGFDWFLSSVFLLCASNFEKCQKFLDQFVTLPISLILWPVFAERKGIQHFYLAFSSLVDLVTNKDIPLASAALQSNGISWGIVCYGWLSQCFWNVLRWNQVCEWFTLCILYPPDVAIYFCAALLSHLQPMILEASSSGKVWDQIIGPFASFSLYDHMPFIDNLIKHHRSIVLPKLLQIIKV